MDGTIDDTKLVVGRHWSHGTTSEHHGLPASIWQVWTNQHVALFFCDSNALIFMPNSQVF
jgi:hypothetical protein